MSFEVRLPPTFIQRGRDSGDQIKAQMRNDRIGIEGGDLQGDMVEIAPTSTIGGHRQKVDHRSAGGQMRQVVPFVVADQLSAENRLLSLPGAVHIADMQRHVVDLLQAEAHPCLPCDGR